MKIFEAFGIAISIIIFAIATLILLYLSYVLAIGLGIVGLTVFIYKFRKYRPDLDEPY